MEKTGKSALEISLEIVGPLPVPGARKWKAGLGNQDLIIKAMEAYADQQLSEYKEVIKELLPLVIAYSMHLEGLGNYESLNERITSSIDRAKKLIEK